MVSFGTWFNTSMTQRDLKAGTDYGFFAIPNVNPALPKTSMIFESGPLCSLTKAADPDASQKYLKWWITPAGPGQVGHVPRRRLRQPQGDDQGPGARPGHQGRGSGEYRLVNRYFEATPPPILTAALDGFSKFVTEPGTYKKVLATIQKAADDYWSTHQ